MPDTAVAKVVTGYETYTVRRLSRKRKGEKKPDPGIGVDFRIFLGRYFLRKCAFLGLLLGFMQKKTSKLGKNVIAIDRNKFSTIMSVL